MYILVHSGLAVYIDVTALIFMAPQKAHLCVDMVKSSPKILSLRRLAVYIDVFCCIHFPLI